MNNYRKIELACLHFVHHLAFNDSKDLRFIKNERHKDLKKWALRCVNGMNPKVIDLYIRRFKELGLFQLQETFDREYDNMNIFPGYYFHPIRATCCDSCHTGTSSTTLEELILQREKYGTFICRNCEKISENIDGYSFSLLSQNGFYKNDGLTWRDEKLIGFGGSRIVIRKKDGKIILTNNLISVRSVHKLLMPKLKDKINCEIFWVNDFKESSLHFLTHEEKESIKPQIEMAKKYGHTVE